MGRYEWVIIEFLVLGLCVWELVNLRRIQRRDRQARPPGEPGTGE